MKVISIIIILIFSTKLQAQQTILTYLDSDYFQQRIKTLDDFIMRFNYEQSFDGTSLYYNDSLKNERLKIIAGLFDADLILNAKNDTTLGNLIIDFINKTVLDSVMFLDYYSTEWYAELNCNITYLNKENNLTLYLKTEVDSLGISKWVLNSCNSAFLDITPKDSSVRISPVNHNLNFIDLIKISKNKNESISAIKSKRSKEDNNSILFFLIKNKMISIEQIKEVSFHFHQIKGYYFKVEFLNKENINSGWLITEIQKK